ncbi:MAG: HEAT repeat domain-containing protein [Bryobacteraceae bacterium]
MTCDAVRKLIPLYYYGELSPEEEDQAEAHIHDCTECTRQMEAARTLAAALDRRRMEAPAALLDDCRVDLAAAVRGLGAQSSRRPWRLWLEAVEATLAGFSRWRQPLSAVALIAIGFFTARLIPAGSGVSTPSLAPSEAVFVNVRSAQPDSAGRVHIAYDETRRREISGAIGNRDIQKLLLAAAHEEDDPGVRVESVGLLKDQAGSGEVRDALLNALLHDSNPGVRLKALEGLKPLAAEPPVRGALSQALQFDDNDAVRMQAVDLLTMRRDNAMVGVLQNLVQKEDNGYVRLKCEKALKEMNASIGTF